MGVCKLSQVYVTSIQRTISATIRVGDSYMCGDTLLGERTCWRGGPSTLAGAAVFAEELQRTDNNGMSINRYLNQRAEAFLIDDSITLISFVYNTDIEQYYDT